MCVHMGGHVCMSISGVLARGARGAVPIPPPPPPALVITDRMGRHLIYNKAICYDE